MKNHFEKNFSKISKLLKFDPLFCAQHKSVCIILRTRKTSFVFSVVYKYSKNKMIMKSLSTYLGIALFILIVYSYFTITNLHDDLETSERNNVLLQQSLKDQLNVIESLEQSHVNLQAINKELNSHLNAKTKSLSNLQKKLSELKASIVKEPKKYEDLFNAQSKAYTLCIFDVTSSNIDSDKCKEFK